MICEVDARPGATDFWETLGPSAQEAFCTSARQLSVISTDLASVQGALVCNAITPPKAPLSWGIARLWWKHAASIATQAAVSFLSSYRGYRSDTHGP